MSTKTKIIIGVVVVGILFILGVRVNTPLGGVMVGPQSFIDGLTVDNGLTVDTLTVESIVSTGAVSGTTITGTGDVTSGDDFISTLTSGTSTLQLKGTASCIELVATNGSTTKFQATSSISGLVQSAGSCE